MVPKKNWDLNPVIQESIHKIFFAWPNLAVENDIIYVI